MNAKIVDIDDTKGILLFDYMANGIPHWITLQFDRFKDKTISIKMTDEMLEDLIHLINNTSNKE